MIFDEIIKQLEIIIKATNKMEKLKEELDVLNEFMEDFMEDQNEEDSIDEEEIEDDGEEVEEPDRKKSLRDIVTTRIAH